MARDGDVSTRDLHWMELHVDKAIAAKEELDWAEFGRYVFMWLSQWRRGGRLPRNLDRFARVTLGMSPEEWEAFWSDPDGPLISSKYLQDGDGFYHPFLEEIAARSLVTYRSNATRAGKGGDATREAWARVSERCKGTGWSPKALLRELGLTPRGFLESDDAGTLTLPEAPSLPLEGLERSKRRHSLHSTATANKAHRQVHGQEKEAEAEAGAAAADSSDFDRYRLHVQRILRNVLQMRRQLRSVAKNGKPSEVDVAASWWGDGIPIETVEAAMTNRGNPGGRVGSLHYYNGAVRDYHQDETADGFQELLEEFLETIGDRLEAGDDATGTWASLETAARAAGSLTELEQVGERIAEALAQT